MVPVAAAIVEKSGKMLVSDQLRGFREAGSMASCDNAGFALYLLLIVVASRWICGFRFIVHIAFVTTTCPMIQSLVSRDFFRLFSSAEHLDR